MGKVLLPFAFRLFMFGFVAGPSLAANLPKMELKPLWPNVVVQRPHLAVRSAR